MFQKITTIISILSSRGFDHVDPNGGKVIRLYPVEIDGTECDTADATIEIFEDKEMILVSLNDLVIGHEREHSQHILISSNDDVKKILWKAIDTFSYNVSDDIDEMVKRQFS